MNEQLFNQLKEMDFKSSDTILIHSSLKSIGIDGTEIIDTLKEYFKDGLILFPTHTWAQMDATNNKFDRDKEPSCVGLLTNIFRETKGVYRSNHPTHSMAGYGKGAKEYLKGAEDDLTPCHPNGAWGRLSDVGAKILLVGTNFARNTFIHAVEEKIDVPNRFTLEPIEFELKINNNWVKKPFYKHWHPEITGLSEYYVKIEPEMIEKGIVKKGYFGNAETLYFDALELQEYILDKLKDNINYFTT